MVKIGAVQIDAVQHDDAITRATDTSPVVPSLVREYIVDIGTNPLDENFSHFGNLRQRPIDPS